MSKKENKIPVCQECTFHKNHPGTCYLDVPVYMGRKAVPCSFFKRKKGGK